NRGPSLIDDPTTITSLITVGGEMAPYWPISVSRPKPSLRSTAPSTPKAESGCPVLALRDHNTPSLAAIRILPSPPSSQNETPRWLLLKLGCRPRCHEPVSNTQISSPVMA